MLTQDWKPVDSKNTKPIVEKINALHDFTLFDAETTRLREQRLPFYEDYMLLQATEFSARPPMSMNFLFRSGEIIKLDGSSAALDKANSKAKINLNKQNIVAYAKFYLNSLMTSEGNFRLVESIDEIEFSSDPSKEELDQMFSVVRPAEVGEVVKKTMVGFDISAIVLYADCVYNINLFVSEKGSLDILNEKVLLSKMPVRQIMLR